MIYFSNIDPQLNDGKRREATYSLTASGEDNETIDSDH